MPIPPEGILRRAFAPGETTIYVAGSQPVGNDVNAAAASGDLANQVGDDAIRDRVLRDWQPNGSYDNHQRPFDKHNHESGLFGPVTMTTNV